MKIIETKEDLKEYKHILWKKFWKSKNIDLIYFEKTYEIKEKNTRIGYIDVYVLNGVLYVDDILIEEEHRGKGIGKKIMEFIDTLAKNNNCHKIRLQTSSLHMPNAFHLYKNSGYSVETKFKNDWFNDDWEIMSKFIDDNLNSKSET
jgi:GNAT superfamily N-acetyltransferase